jgi:hypothetical protein
MRLRLAPEDEYMHEVEEATTFNESMYTNVYDPTTRFGAFFRVGNRPNEGHAEMTVCLYLPDGRVVFMFDRPRIEGNAALDAGGARFEVVTPFEELRVSYDGKAVILDDPLAMADPKKAFTESPWTTVSAALVFKGTSLMFGGEPEGGSHERPGEEFAKGHYEQLVAGQGTITVGDESWTIDGFGLRDHSWGPRTWQAPWYYRWLTGNAGPTFGFMASRIARRDSEGTHGGFLWDDGVFRLVDRVELSTSWQGEDNYHEAIKVTLHSGDDSWGITGRVLNLIPLRNRREGMVTRISEGLTEWSLDDGRVGYGLSEYLDQIIDGRPVGIGE